MSDQPATLKQRMLARCRLSLPVWAAVAVGVVLMLITIVVWTAYSLDPRRVAWGNYMSFRQAVPLLLLWCACCILTYWSVRLWMRQPPVGDRVLREGWRAGREWLASHSASLSNLPVFIVLGCWSRHLQTQVIVSGQHAPSNSEEGDTAIDWVLADEGIFLICRDVGVYGRLLRKSRVDRPQQQSVSLARLGTAPNSSPAQTTDLGHNLSGPSSATESVCDESSLNDEATIESRTESGNDSAAGSMDREGVEGTSGTATATRRSLRPATVGRSGGNGAFHALDRVESLIEAAVNEAADVVAPRVERTGDRDVHRLDSVETAAAQARMGSLCSLMRAARFPRSPINGTVVIVDAERIADEEQARSFGQAIRSDLEQIRTEMGVSAPTSTMVISQRAAEDFGELARRTARGDHQQARDRELRLLGRDFDAAEIPTAEAMCRLVDEAVSRTCDGIEGALADSNSLSQPNNHRLVRLAIRCRAWRGKLRWLMVESNAARAMGDEEPGIVSGLYLAGSGAELPRRIWLDAAWQRVYAEQHHLNWTREERDRQRRERAILTVLTTLTIVLAAVLVAQLVWPK